MPELTESFYKRTASSYDEHQIKHNTQSLRAYAELGACLPTNSKSMLSLGPGTGLELQSVFRRFPTLLVDAIDISPNMVKILLEKFPEEDIRILLTNYHSVELRKDFYDVAAAINSLSGLLKDDKIELFHRIRDSLRNDGVFLYFDAFAPNQEVVDLAQSEYEDAVTYGEIKRGNIYNFYLPLTLQEEMMLLRQCGFKVEHLWTEAGSSFLKCYANK